MADYIQERVGKLKASITQLQEEIQKAENGLKKILDNTEDVLTRFDDVQSTQVFLKEYSKINSQLKNYIVTVEDINCKLDLLDLESKTDCSDDFDNRSIISEIITKPRLSKNNSLTSVQLGSSNNLQTPEKPFESDQSAERKEPVGNNDLLTKQQSQTSTPYVNQPHINGGQYLSGAPICFSPQLNYHYGLNHMYRPSPPCATFVQQPQFKTMSPNYPVHFSTPARMMPLPFPIIYNQDFNIPPPGFSENMPRPPSSSVLCNMNQEKLAAAKTEKQNQVEESFKNENKTDNLSETERHSNQQKTEIPQTKAHNNQSSTPSDNHTSLIVSWDDSDDNEKTEQPITSSSQVLEPSTKLLSKQSTEEDQASFNKPIKWSNQDFGNSYSKNLNPSCEPEEKKISFNANAPTSNMVKADQNDPKQLPKLVPKQPDHKSLGREIFEADEPGNIHDYGRLKKFAFNTTTGTIHTVLVDHIASPGELYLQFGTIMEEFKAMRIEVKKYFNNSYNKLELQQVYHSAKNTFVERKDQAYKIVGCYGISFCAEDDDWFRVRISDWRINDDDDLVQACYIDYGDSQLISLSTLYPLPIQFERYSIYAVKCHLSGIYPVLTKPDSWMKDWCENSTKTLLQIKDSLQSFVNAEVCEPDGCYPEDSLPVKLVLLKGGCINDMLCEYDCAVKLDKPPRVLKMNLHSKLEQWDPMKDDFDSPRNDIRVNTDDSSIALYGYKGTDESRICKVFDQSGSCYKGDTCKKEHVKKNKYFWTSDTVGVAGREYCNLDLPKVGEIMNVEVATILGVNKFYCLKEKKTSKNEDEDLSSLVQYMNSAQNIAQMKKLIIPPAMGQIVLGKFSQDSNWYRAKVIASNPDTDVYELFYVDYGNTEVTTIQNLREMEDRYMHLQFQALECILENIELNPDANLEEIHTFLEQIVNKGSMKIKVLNFAPESARSGNNLTLGVQLHDADDFDVSGYLVAYGYAKYKKVIDIDVENAAMIPG